MRSLPVDFVRCSTLSVRRLPLCAVLGSLLATLGPIACSTKDDVDDGDSDAGVDTENFPNVSCADVEGTCVEVRADQVDLLQQTTNALENDMTIVLGKGTFDLDNQVTLRGATGVTLRGQSMDLTILDFAGQAAQSNGVDSVGDNFTVRDLTILDAKKDGLRVEDSDGITIDSVRATWTNENDPENGSYGIYPVKVSHVLIQNSEAFNSSDAGIYVGQCQHAIVRDNIARGNVAGIEIENTQFADVYGNLAEDNTGGLVVFDLPGNPVVGRDIHLHDNMVLNNNRQNFAPGGVVRQIPPGTGTFAMASRRVEINNNTYDGNGVLDIALLSGFAVEPDPTVWQLDKASLVGDVAGLELVDLGDAVQNYRTDNVWLHDNSHSNVGTNSAGVTEVQELGLLLVAAYGATPIDGLIYDGFSESMFSATDGTMVSNDNSICIENETGTGMVNLNLPGSLAIVEMGSFPTLADFYRPAAPYAPYDCSGFSYGGPVIPPDMAD